MMLIFQLVLLAVLAVPHVQPTPNFAGTWTPVEGVNPVVDLVVTQSATLLTAKAGDEPEHRLEYRLDGAETKQAEGTVRSKAQWDGARLAIVNTFMGGDTVMSVQKQFWSLDTTGQLVIETVRERDGQTRSTKSIYKRR